MNGQVHTPDFLVEAEGHSSLCQLNGSLDVSQNRSGGMKKKNSLDCAGKLQCLGLPGFIVVTVAPELPRLYVTVNRANNVGSFHYAVLFNLPF